MREGFRKLTPSSSVSREENSVEEGEWLAQGNTAPWRQDHTDQSLELHFCMATSEVMRVGWDSQPLQASHQFHWSLKIEMKMQTPLLGDFHDPNASKEGLQQPSCPPLPHLCHSIWDKHWHRSFSVKTYYMTCFILWPLDYSDLFFLPEQQPLGYFTFLPKVEGRERRLSYAF